MLSTRTSDQAVEDWMTVVLDDDGPVVTPGMVSQVDRADRAVSAWRLRSTRVPAFLKALAVAREIEIERGLIDEGLDLAGQA
jgi:hypothetical protein